nr:MAG TPA: hypothetical protein [Caudoviricetes sp.]
MSINNYKYLSIHFVILLFLYINIISYFIKKLKERYDSPLIQDLTRNFSSVSSSKVIVSLYSYGIRYKGIL